MPVNPEIKALADASLAAGREVVLASAADEALVRQLAGDHGLSTRIVASDGVVNRKGRAKAVALVELYGENGFDYAGNENTDRPIWEKAENALMVGQHPVAMQALSRAGKSVVTYPGGWAMRDLIRALRPHQWVKNVLLVLPMLAAHEFTLGTLWLVVLGMAAFSAAASTIYIINDLLDLEADRLHPKKHLRPFASGAVPIVVGMVASVALGALAVCIGLLLGPVFLAVLAVYMILSLAYSLRLKRMRWVDIATLAALYTVRVVGGAAAAGVNVSGFMLVFIFPIFVTLGCVKRLTELTLATNDERLPGRGYGRPDRGDLLNMAGLGAVAALLVFLGYTFSDQAAGLFRQAGLRPDRFRDARQAGSGPFDADPVDHVLCGGALAGMVRILRLSVPYWLSGAL